MIYVRKRDRRGLRLAVGEARVLCSEQDDDDVGRNEEEGDTDVATALAELDLQATQELIAYAELAVAAVGRGVGVVDVASSSLDELVGPLSTRLADRWLEPGQLAGPAYDGKVVQFVDNLTADEIL